MSEQSQPKVHAEQVSKPAAQDVAKPATLPVRRIVKMKKPRPEVNPLQRLLDLSA